MVEETRRHSKLLNEIVSRQNDVGPALKMAEIDLGQASRLVECPSSLDSRSEDGFPPATAWCFVAGSLLAYRFSINFDRAARYYYYAQIVHQGVYVW